MQIFPHTDISKLFAVKEPIPVHPLYWTSEMYGFGKHIRKYGYYSKKMPIHLFTDHSGPCLAEELYFIEKNTDAQVVLFHSPERVKKWKKFSDKPCYTLYSPFVFFRRNNKIDVSSNAKGTLAYPAHTIPELDNLTNMENYIFQLKNLPLEFQPVSVSLHYHDINKGLHKIFLKNDIPVYTAGNPHDYSFTQNFYSVLRNFKYATSNEIGSYLFYAVEMNIPFFLYGNRAIYEKNTESALALAALDCTKSRDKVFDLLTDMFSSATDSISLEQKRLVESTLGLYEGVSRLKMAQLLYSTLITYRLRNLFSVQNWKARILRLLKKSTAY